MTHFSYHCVHSIYEGHPEDSGGVGVQTDGEDVTVSMVASELSHEAVHHEIPIGEGGDAGNQGGGAVQEGRRGREEKTLQSESVMRRR